MGSGGGDDNLETIIISSALVFTAVVFGTAFLCAFIPTKTLVEYATKYAAKSRALRAILKLTRAVAALTKRDDHQFGGRRKSKVAPELTDDEATAAAKRALKKRKKRIEELGLASYTPGMAWCVDRALDAEGNAMYEQGLRLFVETTSEDGDDDGGGDDDEEAPFIDMGEVVGAEALEAFPGVIRLRREGKGNVALELCNFDPGMFEKAGIGSEPLWRDLNEKEWELCGDVGVFDRDMFGRPEMYNPEKHPARQGFHPELLEILQLLTRAAVVAVNGTTYMCKTFTVYLDGPCDAVDEDAKMNCREDFWVVDRLVNVAGRPMVHKGVHMYLEDGGDPDDADDDEMKHAGRVVSAQEARNRVGVVKIITADPAGEMAVQSRKFRGSAIDQRGLTREPLWATMAPRWIDHGSKGERGGAGRAGAGLQALPRVTAGELATVLTRTLAVDRQLESGAVDADQWRKARGMDPVVRDVEVAVEEALDRLLYQRGNPEGYEAAQERAKEAEEAAARRATTELRIFIKETKMDDDDDDGGGGGGGGGLGMMVATTSEGGGGGGEGGEGEGGEGGGGGGEEAAAAAWRGREAAEGRGAVSVDDEGAARGEVRIDVNMGDRDTVYLHLDAEVLAHMHAKRE